MYNALTFNITFVKTFQNYKETWPTGAYHGWEGYEIYIEGGRINSPKR